MARPQQPFPAEDEIANWEGEGGAAPILAPDDNEQPVLAEATSETAPRTATRRSASRWVVSRRVWWAAGGLTLVAALLAASWFLLPIRNVSVVGNSHLSEAEVKRLAGISPRFGWLYYGGWRAQALAHDPWVASAVITRKFPNSVSVQITERQPFLRWQKPDGELTALAQDGQALPGASNLDKLPLVAGWGPDRIQDTALVVRALSRYTVQSVAYTPSGVTVKLAGGTVWSGDLKSLMKYAGSISMYPNKKLNIYPWGVSVQ